MAGRSRGLRGSLGSRSARAGRNALGNSAGCLGNSEGGSAPLPKPPPDAGRAAGRRGAGAPPSEASNLRMAPAKPALEADHSCSRGHRNYLDRPLASEQALEEARRRWGRREARVGMSRAMDLEALPVVGQLVGEEDLTPQGALAAS